MKVGIFSIQDKLIGFKQPFCEMSKEVALRNFKLGIEHEYQGEVHSALHDMALYKLGEFDSDTGLVTGYDVPEFVTSGLLVISDLALHKEGVFNDSETL